jgi:hypothetical protein
MKRHLRGVAIALALLPAITFADSPSQVTPASVAAAVPGYASALKGYVRPEAPTSSPDKEWLAANRALREDGGMDMGGMQMGGTSMGGMQMGAKSTDGKAMKDMPMGDKPMSAKPMDGMRMPGMEAPKPAATTPADPHEGHQMKNNGH